MKKTLSVTEWHQMALDGTAPPMRIQLNGGSMAPLIRMNRDYVTIIPLEGNLEVGDIILFSDLENERYVVHRVWEIRDDIVLTWGDNCVGPDRRMHIDAVWGKAVLIERGRRKIHPDPKKGIRWARFWHHAGKGYRLLMRYEQGIARRIRKEDKT